MLVLKRQARRTVARVQQDADRRAKGMLRDVVAELRANNTRVTVRPSHTAPDHTEPGATDLVLRLVNVRNALWVSRLCDKSTHLAKVKLSILRVFDTLDLDQRHVRVLRALAPPVTHDPTLAVKTRLFSQH